MEDVLKSLAELSSSVNSQPRQPQRQVVRKSEPRPHVVRQNGIIVKSGPGGLQFDFGNTTGNPHADRATAMLNHFPDPMQQQIARDQASEINKAFSDYVALGEHAYNAKIGQMDLHQKHAEANKELSKSTDQVIKEMHERGELTCEEQQQSPNASLPMSKSYDAEINVGGELTKATSETDQAVIEMMKSSGFGKEEGADEQEY
jgi:hypothetical protein